MRGRRDVRDQRGEDALGQPHVQSPQRDPGKQQSGPRAAARATSAAASASMPRASSPCAAFGRTAADRVGRQRVHHAHHHQHHRDQRKRHVPLGRAQHEERLAEAGEGDQHAQQRQPPEGRAQPHHAGAVERQARGAARGVRRFGNTQQQQDRDDAGHHREPQHGADVVGEVPKQRNRAQGTEHGAHRIHRLAQAEARTADRRRREVADQRIAWRAADALAETVQQPRGRDIATLCASGEQRLHRRRQSIPEHHQRFCACRSRR